jgi:1,2-phenylacetyl-CoA epoxidase catalytic subunit
MKVENTTLPKKYHDAVLHWQRHNFPSYSYLADNWEKYFPQDEPFCLCAKMELGGSDLIQIGDKKGEPKRLKPTDLSEEEARHLLAIIRAQASTEFGSIQQHEATLQRAADDEDRFWVLRVMAEELRHGYQMIHLLLTEDWSHVSGMEGEDIVEDILSMQTGSHVLDAFNLDYDSFVDNVVFAAFIDRVGKYQLTMQKICAYKPFAQSMPPMLREEAFHLAAGVIPMRRWAKRAAAGDPHISMPMLQRSVNKWFPRALEMFGDERGGDTNVRFGFKDLKNREAQDAYIEEVKRMLRDINGRYLRARHPRLGPEQAEQALAAIERGERYEGTGPDDLLSIPDRRFFRRKGEPAYTMVGVRGESFEDADAYVKYLAAHLPEAYMASRDMREYHDRLQKLAKGEMTLQEAMKRTPVLKRVGGACPCSKSVRWVVEEPAVGESSASPAAHA